MVGEQNNTCVPVERARESAERRSYTMGGAALARDDSRMLSGLHQLLRVCIFLGIDRIFIGSDWLMLKFIRELAQ